MILYFALRGWWWNHKRLRRARQALALVTPVTTPVVIARSPINMCCGGSGCQFCAHGAVVG